MNDFPVDIIHTVVLAMALAMHCACPRTEANCCRDVSFEATINDVMSKSPVIHIPRKKTLAKKG